MFVQHEKGYVVGANGSEPDGSPLYVSVSDSITSQIINCIHVSRAAAVLAASRTGRTAADVHEISIFVGL